jgi:hypothetical protein
MEPRNGDGMEIVIRIHLDTSWVIRMAGCFRVFRLRSVELFYASVVKMPQSRSFVTIPRISRAESGSGHKLPVIIHCDYFPATGVAQIKRVLANLQSESRMFTIQSATLLMVAYARILPVLLFGLLPEN